MGATNPNAGGAPGGGGKGGMGRNPVPGGNAQNNPSGPQANYGMSPMQAWAKMGQGLGSAGPVQSFPGQSIDGGGWWGGRPAPMRPSPTQLQIAPPTPQQPVRNSVGLPAGGILAKLYGG